MLKSIIYFVSSLTIFFAGIILYGMVLNLSDTTLPEAVALKKLRYLTNVHLVINRRSYKLELYSDTTLVKSYRAVFGKNSPKQRSLTDNYSTPVGKYIICEIDSASQYQKFFRLNYPNSNDVAEAYNSGMISYIDYENANDALLNNQCPRIPKLKVPVIGIHGIGRLNFVFKNLPFVYNWTNGSVAVSNESIDELFSVIKIGTEVEIKD